MKPARRLVLFVFALAGASALMYEVVWSRLLQTILSSTAYTSSTIIATFLLGFSAGSLLSRHRAVRDQQPLRTMGLILIVIGGYGLSFAFLLDWIKLLYLALPAALPVRVSLAMLTLALPATLFGALWPYVSQHCTDENGVGRLYSVNSNAAAVGALTAGFLFIPLLGFRETSVLAAVLDFLGGVLLLAARRKT